MKDKIIRISVTIGLCLFVILLGCVLIGGIKGSLANSEYHLVISITILGASLVVCLLIIIIEVMKKHFKKK